ncbi:hypothetical protein MMC26_003709 [Xylographa opegraphella]|nr:hypothetical protein [Xylographa opegraphella]
MTFRCFARFYVTRAAGPDDYLMIVAALLSWAFIVVTIIAVNHGLGSHMQVVLQRGEENLIEYAQIIWFSSIFYNACLGFIKTSVLALYARLGDPKLRRLALVMIALVGCQSGANVLTCIFQCNPIEAAWNLAITNKVCVDIDAFYLANAALNITTDLLAYTLPIQLVLKLQVPFKQKCILFVMFFLGLFACISSIVRITFIPQMLVDPDATWAITAAMYWSVIETNIGILAASIPTFKAIAKRYFPRFVGESSYAGNSYLRRRTDKSGGSRSFPFNKLEHTGSYPMNSRKGNDSTYATEELESGEQKERGVHTRIEHKGVESGSQERIVYPQGQIMAQTEITTHVEEASDRASY